MTSNTNPYTPPEDSEGPGADAAEAPSGAPLLSERMQRGNSLLFILNNSIGYLVAPVFYVGVLHAAILSSLGFSDTLANLPESVYLWMVPVPVIVAWIWPSTRYLRRLLIMSCVLKGLFGLLAAALFFFAPPAWLASGIVAHAAVLGATGGVSTMCLWELIGRGMTPERRGWTLSITFGAGPVLAVLGSCLSQLILSGNFLDLIQVKPAAAPWSYVLLFGATVPAMAVSALAAWSLARLPDAEPEAEPQVSFRGITEGLRQYFTHRLILVAVAGFLLTSAGGNMILNNLGLYVREVTGESPEQYTGIQLALRFGCKSLFGFVLGWMLSRHHARMPALATTVICTAGVVWALVVPGRWYLLSFGLLGAGELYYVYYLNYIIACSEPHRMRENTAYSNVITIVVSLMPLIYGRISDAHGVRASLYVALGILIVGLLIVGVMLPPRPQTCRKVSGSGMPTDS